MYVAKTKALISFAVTAKLICVFVFAYAKCWFSHDAAHFAIVSQRLSFLEYFGIRKSTTLNILTLKGTVLEKVTFPCCQVVPKSCPYTCHIVVLAAVLFEGAIITLRVPMLAPWTLNQKFKHRGLVGSNWTLFKSALSPRLRG